MKKIFAILFALVLTVVQIGSASAKSPTCQFNPISLTTEIGVDQQFHITNPDVNNTYTWIWGDSSDPKLGATAEHAWNALGTVKMHVLSSGPAGFSRCYSWVTVIAKANQQGQIDNNNNDYEEEMGFESIVRQIAIGSTTGDGSPIINNSGDGNPITITTAASQPIVIQPDPVVTQKTNVFTAFIHATLKATETFFHVLDESWFIPVLVK